MLEIFEVIAKQRVMCFIELGTVGDSRRLRVIGTALEATGWLQHGTCSFKRPEIVDLRELLEQMTKDLDGILIDGDCVSVVDAVGGHLRYWGIAPPPREAHARLTIR